MEAESFEVQAKVRIADPDHSLAAIEKPEIEILRFRHYHEYDTYFSFADPEQGYLRYREDEFIDPNGTVANVRYRLTLLGLARERDFPGGVLLSRSRFMAPATHSLRFYREYFKPSREHFIKKDRLRWRVLYHGIEFTSISIMSNSPIWAISSKSKAAPGAAATPNAKPRWPMS